MLLLMLPLNNAATNPTTNAATNSTTNATSHATTHAGTYFLSLLQVGQTLFNVVNHYPSFAMEIIIFQQLHQTSLVVNVKLGLEAKLVDTVLFDHYNFWIVEQCLKQKIG